ncbi:hypothetical protein HY932_00810 [Candidatus Falkowbacteria bacterium]|nr:hypothetical protein [Candidatus Falkowbacteria bacterium]
MKPQAGTMTRLGRTLIENVATPKQQKRPKPHAIVRPENNGETIAAIRGKRENIAATGNAWMARIFLCEEQWLGRTNPDEVSLGTDLVCFINKQPLISTDAIYVTRVFRRFCVGKVVTIN